MTGEVWVSYKTGTVCSKRPFAMQKIFLNRSPQQVVQLVGLSYALCGVAQQFSASLALAVSEKRLDEFDITAGLQAVRWETLREHVMSLTQLAVSLQLIPVTSQAQWLQGIGQWTKSIQPDAEKYSQAQGLLQKWGGQILWQTCTTATTISDIDLAIEAEIQTHSLLGQVFQKLTQIDPLLIPFQEDEEQNLFVHQLSANTMCNMLSQDWQIWAEKPEILGKTYENSVLGRMMVAHPILATFSIQKPLAARLLARWLEMNELLVDSSDITLDAASLYGYQASEDGALAWVETARGRLWHFADCNSGQVKKYAISAPTEWNFHPKSHFARWIKELKKSVNREAWKHDVSVVAQVMDPCVPLRFDELSET